MTQPKSSSSSLSELTLQVRQDGVSEQEVFLQHGLSIGRNPSNTICIDDPQVERIHAQILRQADGSMLLECSGEHTQLTLANGSTARSLVLEPGSTFKIGPATIRCLQRATRPSVVVTTNIWQVRCPRCHENLADAKRTLKACPGCKLELHYFQSQSAEGVPFEGWLPRQIGPYLIRTFVAQGGMGIVLRGIHKDTDLPAAVKLLRLDSEADPTWAARFNAEIQLLKGLKHPNVVRLQEHGQEDKMPWLAMDWIDGLSLSKWIARDRAANQQTPIDAIRDVMKQAVEGLAYLHARQIVHRDLKPGNIIVAQDGLVKLVDFGIAKATEQSTGVTTRMTQTGMVAGTESYMSPEQAEGRTATGASDVYAIGVIWYELLCGRRPMGAFVQPSFMRPDCPPVWSQRITQCLAMDPRSRPTLDQLMAALGGFVAAPAPPFTPPPLAGSGVATPPPTPPPAGGYPPTQASAPGATLAPPQAYGTTNVYPPSTTTAWGQPPPAATGTFWNTVKDSLRSGWGATRRGVGKGLEVVRKHKLKWPLIGAGGGLALLLLIIILWPSSSPTNTGGGGAAGGAEAGTGAAGGQTNNPLANLGNLGGAVANPDQLFQQAQRLLQSGNEREGLALMERAANAGVMPAQYALGFHHYQQGNYLEAAKWWRKASDQGNPQASAALGILYRDGHGVRQNDFEAASLFLKAANAGDALGMSSYAAMLEAGRGVQRNPNLALQYYVQAARNGDEFARQRLQQLGYRW